LADIGSNRRQPPGRFGAHVGGAGIVREALAEIDRVALARQPRHDLEDADAKPGEKGVHGSPLDRDARI